MCIYLTKLKNPRYKKVDAPRGLHSCLISVPVNCGTCSECRRERASQWRIRLLEEYKTNKIGVFVTFTFSEESGEKIEQITKKQDSESIAKWAIKHWRERWRKKYGKSPRYWLITELGHKGTQRLHLHGFIFVEKKYYADAVIVHTHAKKIGRHSQNIEKIWSYGRTMLGYSEINEKNINYCTKYVTKDDREHPGFYGRIFTSPGIGKGYAERMATYHKFNGEKTNKFYRLENGHKKSMPLYYKNKLWNEKEREKLRIIWHEKNITRIGGKQVASDNEIECIKATKEAQTQELQLGLRGDKKAAYLWKSGEKCTFAENKTK